MNPESDKLNPHRAVRCSALLGVNQSGENESAVGAHSGLSGSFLSSGCLRLAQLLDILLCPQETMLDHLARTPKEREGYEKLLSLWQTLGCPATGFWHETFVNLDNLWFSFEHVLTPNND